MSVLLEVSKISHSFRGLHVLRGVNLGVEEGTITGLIGPNGAGKSTLFNIVSGFVRPDEGRIVYADQEVTTQSVQKRSYAGLMRTFQTPQVFRNMTVRENLIAGCHKRTRSGVVANLLGFPVTRREAEETAAVADAACDRFGLSNVRDQLAGKLPGGQQRMVELARAQVAKPRLLCLDEPSAGLNTEEVAQLMSALRQLNDGGITILLVSHDMDLVAIAATINVLCFGEIIASAPFAEIKSDARVREAYLGA